MVSRFCSRLIIETIFLQRWKIWSVYFQRWEFIKENKKVRKQENALATKKAIKKKNDTGQEKNKNKTRSRPRKKKKTFFLDRFLGRFLGGELDLFFFFLLSCFIL